MIRETINPDNEAHWLELRSKDVTSSEAAALFNLSPYCTKAELWYRKKQNDMVELESTDRMRWGNRLESVIAHGIAEDNGWTIKPKKEYMRLPEYRAGASFDFSLMAGNDTEFGLLEIKNVDGLQYKNKWIIENDVIEAPPQIELQVQHQLLVSGLPFAYIGALIGGNQVVIIKRDRDQDIIDRIKGELNLFWMSIEESTPPPFDFKNDIDLISRLHGYAEPGTVGVATDRIAELAEVYRSASEEMKRAEEKKDAAKAELLTLIGAAEKVKGFDFTISSGLVGPTKVSYERSGYRQFKINWRKMA